jgi:hypothetical protein
LSVKFSNSPELHLEIVESRVHARCLLGACLAVAFALLLLAYRGYPVIAGVLLPCALFSLLGARRDSLAGKALAWRRGRWWLCRGSETVEVEILPASVTLPWLIYLVWREIPGRSRHRAWLFPDCASRDGLRLLRVRLRLQR